MNFQTKIANIRSRLEAIRGQPPSLTGYAQSVPVFSTFANVSVAEVIELVKDCPNKSSTRDPIPTQLLKRFPEHLAIPITNLLNMSLSTGIFPDEMKLAHVTPLLKKQNLCPDDLNNYRPVSLLPFLSKLVERIVSRQLSTHLTRFNLNVSVQSAYRRTTPLKLLF